MAIQSSNELHVTQQQLARIEAALDEMHCQESPEMYGLLCEPYVELIMKMRHEINAYLGIDEDVEQHTRFRETSVAV